MVKYKSKIKNYKCIFFNIIQFSLKKFLFFFNTYKNYIYLYTFILYLSIHLDIHLSIHLEQTYYIHTGYLCCVYVHLEDVHKHLYLCLCTSLKNGF